MKEDILTNNIHKNSMGSIIETDTPVWPKETKRWYHGSTRDWISNEIFRRVHPQGYTMCLALHI